VKAGTYKESTSFRCRLKSFTEQIRVTGAPVTARITNIFRKTWIGTRRAR
jgi:hypothetical protein